MAERGDSTATEAGREVRLHLQRPFPPPDDGPMGAHDVASQWQLMRRRFLKHRLAILGSVVLVLMYLAALFSNFLSPHDPHAAQRHLSRGATDAGAPVPRRPLAAALRLRLEE